MRGRLARRGGLVVLLLVLASFPASAANPGEAVWAQWKPNAWYHGKAQGACALGLQIAFDDGDSLCVHPSLVAADKAPAEGVAVGTRALAKWTDGKPYPATVAAVDGATCDVRFDDGTSGTSAAGDLRLLPAPEPARTAKVGDVVWAQWRPNVFSRGKIDETCDLGLYAQLEGGREGCYPPSLVVVDIAPDKGTVAVGARVLAKWKDGKLYPSTVTGGDGASYLVRYDDGDTGAAALADLRLIASPAPRPAPPALSADGARFPSPRRIAVLTPPEGAEAARSMAEFLRSRGAEVRVEERAAGDGRPVAGADLLVVPYTEYWRQAKKAGFSLFETATPVATSVASSGLPVLVVGGEYRLGWGCPVSGGAGFSGEDVALTPEGASLLLAAGGASPPQPTRVSAAAPGETQIFRANPATGDAVVLGLLPDKTSSETREEWLIWAQGHCAFWGFETTADRYTPAGADLFVRLAQALAEGKRFHRAPSEAGRPGGRAEDDAVIQSFARKLLECLQAGDDPKDLWITPADVDGLAKSGASADLSALRAKAKGISKEARSEFGQVRAEGKKAGVDWSKVTLVGTEVEAQVDASLGVPVARGTLSFTDGGRTWQIRIEPAFVLARGLVLVKGIDWMGPR